MTPQIRVAITVSVGDQSQEFFATADSSSDGFHVAQGVLNGACGDASKWLYERQSASRRLLRGMA